MAVEAATYKVLWYGGADGYQTNRAQIELADAAGKVIAWIRFKDAGMAWEEDYTKDNVIRMHLPTENLPAVVDVLRNEKPVSIFFISGHAFLGTGPEAVGEEE